MPVWGTCAGAIILASKGDGQVKKTGQKLLGLMSMSVNRNAFGRQRESFEAVVRFKSFAVNYPGVFIRAPSIEKVWGKCEPVAFLGSKIAAARQGNIFATTFHPELTYDKRVHEFFLKECCKL